MSEEVQNVSQQVAKYENFIHNTLRPDLERIGQEYEKITARLAEYNTILATIKPLHEQNVRSFKAMTDLGNNCYVKCVVPDADYIYLNIGVNIFVQFRLSEAIQYLENMINSNKPKTDVLVENAAKVKAHIKLTMNLIDQLRSVS